MNSKEVKDIRKQLRNVAKELLPEILNAEQYAELKKHVDARMNEVQEFVKATMTEMKKRHEDTLGYLVRQASAPIEPPKSE